MADILAKRYLHQTAVYWPKDSNDRFGKPSYGTPIEIPCRWDDETVENLGPGGREFTSNVSVLVDRDLVKGGALTLTVNGLADIVNMDNPFHPSNPKTWEIMKFNKTPNRKATKFLREAIL